MLRLRYKRDTRDGYGWIRNMIYLELCKRLKFDHMTKWYIHKPESVPENKTHKILRDFEKQTDLLIQARRPNLVLIYKK